MSIGFAELGRDETPMGAITLRRRREPTLDVDVYEVKLGDEFLMSSLFTVAEIALADLALDVVDDPGLDVVVAGLGLGYTARAALGDPRVRSLRVIEALPAVIGWHERHLVPIGIELTGDARCRLVEGDFFARIANGEPFAAGEPDRVHAFLVDVDHSPAAVLHPSHADFYTTAGLSRLADRLRPGGVFGLWADGDPDPGFVTVLESVFTDATAHVVSFPNFYTGDESASTVYIASQ